MFENLFTRWLRNNLKVLPRLNPINTWGFLTLIYVCLVIFIPFWGPLEPLESYNEWGDWLAGTLAPAALFWLVKTLHLQRQELAAQREELKLQREEMRLSREVLNDQGKQLIQIASNGQASLEEEQKVGLLSETYAAWDQLRNTVDLNFFLLPAKYSRFLFELHECNWADKSHWERINELHYILKMKFKIHRDVNESSAKVFFSVFVPTFDKYCINAENLGQSELIPNDLAALRQILTTYYERAEFKASDFEE